MKVVVAIDSFKGSLNTFQSGNAVCEGIKKVYPDAEVKICPIADGGEGTVDAIVSALSGEKINVDVHNPIGEIINASYGIIPESQTAIIEMSAAAGITLIDENERNPMNTTTYGVGEMIIDAVSKGCRRFIVGIGGSATNDGGVGMLQALGFEFLDSDGNQVSYGAKGLKEIVEIYDTNVLTDIKECSFTIACDVVNPLCGEFGCSKIFGPQKGATPEMTEEMDSALLNFAKKTKDIIGSANADAPGSGAAGGMGFAFMTYLGGVLKSGIELIIETTGIEKAIKEADIVVTGEGKIDGQSSMGKAPIGIAGLSKKYNKTVIAFAGCVTEGAEECNKNGIDAYFPILRIPVALSEAMEKKTAYANMVSCVTQVFNLIKQLKNNNSEG